MMSFQQFLDEKAKPPGSFTKANSPARLSVASVYPVAKMRG